MKSKKKFVLAGLFLLATVLLLPLTGCETEVDPSTPQQEQTSGNSGSSGGGNTQQPGGNNSGGEDEVGGEKPVTYTVTFNANGGTFADGSTTKPETVESGKKVAESQVPTKYLWNASWSTDPDGSTPYDFNAPVTKDLTLYAKWSRAITKQSETDVCALIPSGGTEPSLFYDNLGEAIDLASMGNGNIVLLGDVTSDSGITIGHLNANFTFDLYGYTLTLDGSYLKFGAEDMKITIMDSSPNKSGAIKANLHIQAHNSEIVVDGVKVVETSSSEAIIHEDGSTIVKDCDLSVTGGSTVRGISVAGDGLTLDGTLSISVTVGYGVEHADIWFHGSYPLKIGPNFQPKEPLSVRFDGSSGGVFAKPAEAGVELRTEWFTSAVDGYHVEKDEDGNLKMVKDNS